MIRLYNLSYLLYEELNLFFLYNFYIVSVGSFIRFLWLYPNKIKLTKTILGNLSTVSTITISANWST